MKHERNNLDSTIYPTCDIFISLKSSISIGLISKNALHSQRQKLIQSTILLDSLTIACLLMTSCDYFLHQQQAILMICFSDI